MSKNETALATRENGNGIQAAEKPNRYALVPKSFDEVAMVADKLANSGMVPKDYQGKPDAVFTAIMHGAEIGLPPMQALQNIAVINGRPGIFGDALPSLLFSSSIFKHEDFVEEFEGDYPKDDFKAVCTMTRRVSGGKERTVTREFSIDDAKTANLWKKSGPWTTYPKRQLQWRARWLVARDLFADIIGGLRAAEELVDLEDADYEIVEDEPAADTPAPSSKTSSVADAMGAKLSEPEDEKTDDPKTDPETDEKASADADQEEAEAPAEEEDAGEAEDVDIGSQKVTRATLKALKNVATECGFPISAVREVAFSKYGASALEDVTNDQASAMMAGMEKKAKQKAEKS